MTSEYCIYIGAIAHAFKTVLKAVLRRTVGEVHRRISVTKIETQGRGPNNTGKWVCHCYLYLPTNSW